MKKILMLAWRVLRPVFKVIGIVLRPVFWLLEKVLSTYMGNGLWKHGVPLSHWISKRLAPMWVVLFGVNVSTQALHLTNWIVMPLIIPMISTALADQSHHDYLCERCVADMPINPQQEVDDKLDALRRYHKLALPVALLYLTVIIPATMFLGNWLYGYGVYIVAAAGMFGLMLPVIHWMAVHGRLRPWCPYCRRGRGGDDEEFAPVAPDPHGVKEPVA